MERKYGEFQRRYETLDKHISDQACSKVDSLAGAEGKGRGEGREREVGSKEEIWGNSGITRNVQKN